jgi:hypothetical protein
VQWFNDTWFFDARSNSWIEVECTGHIPSPREGHSAALVGDIIFVFGGRGSDGKMLGDLFAFKVNGTSISSLADKPANGFIFQIQVDQVLDAVILLRPLVIKSLY